MNIYLGLIFGIFIALLVNYLTDVLPGTRRLTIPGCRVCQQPYTLKQYLFFSSCANCGARRALRSYFVLILSIILSILLYYYPIKGLNYFASLPILLTLGVIAVIDIEHRLVLLETSVFAFFLFLLYGLLRNGWLVTLFGGVVGFLVMLLFFLIGIAFNKMMSRLRHKEIHEVAFGFGDVMMGTVLGLLVGFPAIFEAIRIAIFAFGGFSLFLLLILIVTKRYRAFTNAQPFVPFLIIGALATFLI